ncbi:MAG TPA: carboxypeptidase-like regulatory domain-containing protein [Bacteroidales bacterium]|nr:carboxypeptidase-like regulatory domain-containing protein [Bacteroidales bacterium]
MKTFTLSLFFLPVVLIFNSSPVLSQTVIRGSVSDQKDNPVAYASVAIAGTYEGTVTDDSGRFEIKTKLTGPVQITVTSVGLEPAIMDIDPGKPVSFLKFRLKEAYASLSPAVITAGTFAAGDQGKAELFKSRDLGTTAGTAGDIQATIETLPGTQRVGYTEGLFVRGGSGRESKYIMDGLIFPDPYYSNVPSLKQHGRLDPFLFSGTTFSAGGYSAQYGQALSSVLILNSRGMADSSKSGGGIHCFGGNVFHTQRWNKASLNTNVSYNDLSVYHSLSGTRTNWLKSPQIKELRLVFRYKPGKNSMLKMFADVSETKTGIRLNHTESLKPVDFTITNRNFIFNGNYTTYLKDDRSSVFAGASLSGNFDHITYAGTPKARSTQLAQAKVTFRNSLTNDIRLLAGGEYLGTFLYGRSDTIHSAVNDNLLALFTEAEATIKDKFALRAGLRSEFSQYAGNNLAPRISLAYKFSMASQVSLSYGTFNQLPDNMEMLYNPHGLSHEKASHYLFNYQYQLNERTLRAELYFKHYGTLLSEYEPAVVLKNNAGYAKGFELFYRDKTTIENLDWWVSYSYCDSKRKTIIKNKLVTPDYISAHSVTVVGKYWFAGPGFIASASLSYSSPRWFEYQDDSEARKSLAIPARYGIDISLIKPALILHKPALIFLSWQNITGYDKVLGYMRIPNMDEPFSVYRTEKRSLFIGIFINMYND